MKEKSLFKKGDKLDTHITDIGMNGEGIGKVDGYTLFVKDAVIGDKVSVSIMKAKANYAYAHLDEVLIPSEDRVTPVCPVARSCGGCQLQAMSYEAQLKFKHGKVRNDLIRIGGFDEDFVDSVIQDIEGMTGEPVRYRGKSQFPVGRDRDGNIVTGFYAGHSHSIIPIDDCVTGAEEYAVITRIIREHMKRYDIAPYDEVSGTGLVRHILIRKGFKTGEIMVCLILNRGESWNGMYLTGQDELLEKLAAIKNMTSVSVNLNRTNTNVIMGETTHTIWGSDVIHDVIEPVKKTDLHGPEDSSAGASDHKALTYSISPKSFYQVNPVQTDRLYSLALEYAHLTGKETVWDLYCGIGTISLFLATKAAHVYGVEIVPEAIRDAKDNASINGLDNVSFYTGRAEDIVLSDGPDVFSAADEPSDDEHVAIRLPAPDVIVIDPPRKGCDEALLSTILTASPARIVYVSCDPATLARDLKILCEGGYELNKVTPVDMFPHSIHCETVTELHRTDGTVSGYMKNNNA